MFYGTSGLWNTWEVMQVAQAASSESTGCTFFNYESYPVYKQLELTSYSSCHLLGLSKRDFLDKFSPFRDDKNSPLVVQKKVSEWFASVNGFELNIDVMPFEKILDFVGILEMSVGDLIERMREIVRDSYIAVHDPKGKKIYTSSKTKLGNLENMTVGELQKKGGYVSGRTIHYSLRLLSEWGECTLMAPNNKFGKVYEMYKGSSGNIKFLLVSPVSIRAEGQEPSWAPICPVVFRELIGIWGQKKSAEIGEQIWDIMDGRSYEEDGVRLEVNRSGIVGM